MSGPVSDLTGPICGIEHGQVIDEHDDADNHRHGGAEQREPAHVLFAALGEKQQRQGEDARERRCTATSSEHRSLSWKLQILPCQAFTSDVFVPRAFRSEPQPTQRRQSLPTPRQASSARQQHPQADGGQDQEQHVTADVAGLHAREPVADALANARPIRLARPSTILRSLRPLMNDTSTVTFAARCSKPSMTLVSNQRHQPATTSWAAPAGAVKLVEVPLVLQEAIDPGNCSTASAGSIAPR